MISYDIIETTPGAITKKQGGQVWIISCEEGLLSLYKQYAYNYTPITVFVRERGNVRGHVLWMPPNGGYCGYEF